MIIKQLKPMYLFGLIAVAFGPAMGSAQPTQFKSADPLVQHSLELATERVQLWSERRESYRLNEALEQLERVSPWHPLLIEVRINAALATGNPREAEQLFAQLSQLSPQHAATRRVAERMQETMEVRQNLARIDLLDFAGRYEEAEVLLHEVFAYPPMDLQLALQYWRVVGRATSRERAIGGLQQLEALYPDSPELKMAIISQKNAQNTVDTTDLATLNSYVLDNLYGEEALSLWLRIIDDLPYTRENLAAINQLASYFPNHADIKRYQREVLAGLRAGQLGPNANDSALIAEVEEPTLEPALPDPWEAYSRAQALITAGNPGAAEQEMLALLQENESSDAHFAFALVLESLDRDEDALAQVNQVVEGEAGEGVFALQARLAERERNRIVAEQLDSEIAAYEIERRQTSSAEESIFWLGYDYANRDSTPGISSLEANTLIMRLSVPFKDNPENRWFIQVDPTSLNGGAFDFDDSFWRPRFGTGLICQTDCPTGIGAESKERGVAVGVGAKWDNWRADIGISPFGFLRDEWVGSVRYDGDIGEFGWAAEVERRVLTSAVVNFAGLDDPFSDRSWGPVVRNNLGVSFSWDQNTGWGWWSNLGINHFNGHNVKDNWQWYGFTGVYKNLYDTEALAFDVGATLLTWGFDNDQSQTTYGQGAYYSPGRYASLSIPLSVYGRHERWSYHLRASLGQSTTRLKSSEFYPNDADIQAQAEALQGSTFIDPVFGGGKGGGFGYSLRGALEYRVTDHWYVGLGASIVRSEFFTPNNFTLYFRYHFGGHALPPRRPPAPPQRYVDTPWWE